MSVSFNGSQWYPSSLTECYGGGCGSLILTGKEQEKNGRINVLEPEDPNAKFNMFERVAKKNKGGCVYQDAMRGFFEPNDLSKLFFSADNVKALQEGMRGGVEQLSAGRYVVPPQNEDALTIIMRSTFMNHANFYPTVSAADQVAELNRRVLDYAVPQLFSSAQSYEKYLIDQSTLVVPLTQPLNHDREFKQLSLQPFLYETPTSYVADLFSKPV
jgi:hypothetical protein